MHLIVCIKQVVAGDRVKLDPRTYSVVRSSESSRINPYDLSALDLAGQLKREHSGSITAVTMGPAISEEVLWEALTLGADRAVLLSDIQFASADTLATSYVLGMGIRKIGSFDLILTGMRTSDGDTGQVGPQLAEELDIPFVGAVEKLEGKKDGLRVERTSDGFREVLDLPLPALLTVSSGRPVRLPGLIEIQQAFGGRKIESWNAGDLKTEPARTGYPGSGTWVEGLTPVDRKKSCVLIEGDARLQAKTLLSKLLEKDLLS